MVELPNWNIPVNEILVEAGSFVEIPSVGELAGVGGTPSTSVGDEEEASSREIFPHNAFNRATGERLELNLECLFMV
jgi:hypothetical protein